MLKKGKGFVRIMGLIIAVVMMICLVPTMALASNTVDIIFADVDPVDDTKIKVSGTITEGENEVTILAVKLPAGTELADLVDDEDPSVLENAIVYIDQISSTTGSWEFSFTPRDVEVSSNILTVFVGGTNVETYDYAEISTTTLIDAPDVELVGESPFVWGHQDIVLNVSGDNTAEWLAAVTAKVGSLEAQIDAVAGTITIDKSESSIKPETLEEKEFTIEFEGVEDFVEVSDIDFSVISAIKEAVDANVPKATSVLSADETKYTITIPADYDTVYGAEVEYSVTVGGDDEDISENRSFDVTRVSGENIEVIVTTTISADKYDDYEIIDKITVRDLDDTGPNITKDDITLDGENVYGKTDYRVITIETTEVDPETETIMIDDVPLFYTPQRGEFGKFVGIVNSANEEAALSALEVVETTSEKLYYGRVSFTTSDDDVTMSDAGDALMLYKNTYKDPTDAIYLSADVNGSYDLSAFMSNAGEILRKYKNPSHEFMIID